MFKAFKRFLRVGLSVLIAGAMVYWKNDPKYIALAPVLSAVGKALRTAGVNFPVPF